MVCITGRVKCLFKLNKCILPTNKLHELTRPAFTLACSAYAALEAMHVTLICVCVTPDSEVILNSDSLTSDPISMHACNAMCICQNGRTCRFTVATKYKPPTIEVIKGQNCTIIKCAFLS